MASAAPTASSAVHKQDKKLLAVFIAQPFSGRGPKFFPDCQRIKTITVGDAVLIIRQGDRNPKYKFPDAIGVYCQAQDKMLGNIPRANGGMEPIFGSLLHHGCELVAHVSSIGAHGCFVSGGVYGNSLPNGFNDHQQQQQWNQSIGTQCFIIKLEDADMDVFTSDPWPLDEYVFLSAGQRRFGPVSAVPLKAERIKIAAADKEEQQRKEEDDAFEKAEVVHKNLPHRKRLYSPSFGADGKELPVYDGDGKRVTVYSEDQDLYMRTWDSQEAFN
jgi:hypothetical protein